MPKPNRLCRAHLTDPARGARGMESSATELARLFQMMCDQHGIFVAAIRVKALDSQTYRLVPQPSS